MEDLLRYVPESETGRDRAFGPRSLALCALLLTAAPCLAQSPAAQAAPSRDRGDTTRTTTPFHLRKAVSLNTEYLSRVLAGPAVRPEVEIEIDPPADARAASFAKRYGISAELAQRIVDSAAREGLDPELAFRLIRVESQFKTRARGPQGALGLVQLMPSTARALDRSLRTEAQILDPSNNLRVGFRYLRAMLDRYDGNVRLALLAYNRGENAVDRALRNGRDPENGYSHKVLGTRGSNPYRGSGVLKN
jgi:soluble lytic murein transglycosylase-like protein